jgi:hypothetical protein
MGRKDTKQNQPNHDKHSDSEHEESDEHKHSKKYTTREIRWGILKGKQGEKGEKGSRGKRGPRGKHGHNGKNGHHGKDGCDAVLSFGGATNDLEGEFISNIGDAVEWTNTYFPYLDVSISGNVVNLKNEGVYQFDYSLRGIVGNTSTTFGMGLLYNGNIINGSKFTMTSNIIPPFPPYNNLQLLNGTVIAEIDQPNANVNLINLSDDIVTYFNADMSNNASINVIRLV